MKIKMVVKDADLYKQHKAQQDVLISWHRIIFDTCKNMCKYYRNTSHLDSCSNTKKRLGKSTHSQKMCLNAGRIKETHVWRVCWNFQKS
jgi:hypothetical protein